MKLYYSIGPNPAVVRMVMAEKGIEAEKQKVDLRGGENRQPGYLSINPMGQLPALEVEGGTVLTEITAIAEYLEEVQPAPPLIGTTPVERAQTRMWVRRLDLNIVEPMTNGFRFGEGLPVFRDRVHCIPEASAGLKETARRNLIWLEGQMGARTWIVGERFTLADILLYCFLDFGGKVGQPIDPALTALTAWFARVKQRPSATA